MRYREIISIITLFAFESGRERVMAYTKRFADLKSTRYFVDKSELLEVFFENESRYNFISCPRRFSKTINLQMIETFSQLESDADGNAKHYTNTRAYRLFNDTVIFEQHPEIVRQRMARYVVVYLDLTLDTPDVDASNFTEDVVIRIMNEKLFRCLRAMEEGEYLRMLTTASRGALAARGIDEQDAAFLEKLKLQRLDETEAVHGLGRVSEILHKYFRANVCVLVDEYDNAMVPNALSERREDVELFYIYINEMIIGLLRNADKCNLTNVLVAGTSNLAFGVSHPDPRHFRQRSFLSGHEFEKFFAFSAQELDRLLDKHDVNLPDDRADTKQFYCGYRTDADAAPPLHLCNPYSVARYFDEILRQPRQDPLKTYWISDPVDGNRLLAELLNYAEFRQIASSIVTNRGVSFRRADFQNPPNRMDFLNFLNFYQQKNLEYRQYTYGLFLNFLLGQGFLSYAPRRNVFVAPNSEIKEILREALFRYRTSSKEMLKNPIKFDDSS